jgi:branched-chain amino acid transport system substrate-binding protein
MTLKGGGRIMPTGYPRHAKTTLSRRELLRRAGRAGVALAVGTPLLGRYASPGSAQQRGPIKIGVLLPKSGPYTVQGENGFHGAQLAVEDFGGKVLGKPVQLVWEDESTPQASQQRMRKLIEEDRVVAVSGGINSGNVLAMMPIALQHKVLLMATGPNATEITGKNCNRFTFRVDLPNHVTVRTVYPTLARHGKRWYFISASYAWGIDAYNQMRDLLVRDGGTVLGYDQAPLGTTDFSSFILKVKAANPDVVFLGLGGSDLTNFLKQFKEVGLTGKIPISSPIVNDSDLWAAGPEAATGIYPKLWNYTGRYVTPKSQEFVRKYIAKYGQPPEVEGWQDWFGMTAILTAIQETGSTDSARLIRFLEDHKFVGYKDRPIYFRAWDHQLVQPTLLAVVKAKITDRWDYFDILAEYPLGGQSLDAFYGSPQEVGCHMGGI